MTRVLELVQGVLRDDDVTDADLEPRTSAATAPTPAPPAAVTTPLPDAPRSPEPLSADRLTEAGAAERFVRQHAGTLRYDHGRSRWLFWRGHHFASDLDGEITRLAIDTVHQWQREALDIPDVRAKSAVLSWATAFDRRAKLQAMLALAADLAPVAAAGSAWDRDPWLLGTPTGVVDLHTGELRPGRPDDAITMQTAVGFDREATCPRWLQAIDEWFPDPALADYMARALGYSLTGSMGEQAWFACYSGGANGKSTLLRAVAHVLGDYAYDMPFSVVELNQRSAIPNDLAALAGRRFIMASETNDGTRLNEARLKSWTGGDACTARFLHGEFFTFTPTGKIWLAFNHKPIVRDDSYGFWRRVRLVPFLRTFAPDPTLGDVLRHETPGILAWLIRGCLEWQVRGLEAPEIITDATADYQQGSDVFGRFLTEACEVDEFAEVSATDLYRHYEEWAERQGYGPRERLTMTKFGTKAGERLRRVHTRTGWLYLGVARTSA